MAEHVIFGVVTGPGGGIKPKGGEFFRLEWKTATKDAPTIEHYDTAEQALAHRDKVRARGGTAEVYRSNQATGLNELVP